MRNLLHATDRDRLAAHLRGPLRRDAAIGDRHFTALAEADAPDGGSLCAAAANARAAELLVQPDIRDADPAFTDAVLDFVMAMADQPLPSRRAGAGMLEVPRDDPRDFEVLTPFHRFSGDLSAGRVQQQQRGVGESRPPVQHTGNLAEFRIGRHRSGVDAEETIVDCGLRRGPDSVRLFHESRLTGLSGLLRAVPVPAGTLRYEYEIRAASPIVRLTVTFTAEGQALRRLRVSTAADQLGNEELDFSAGRIESGAAWQDVGAPSAAGLATWVEGKPVAHVALGRAGWPAGAPVLHIRPGDPLRVMGVKAVAREPGTLHWLILRHGPVDLAPGGSLVVREDRLLAAGTSADVAARMMAAPAVAGLDLDPMPPDGAALNAVALHLLFDSHGTYRTPLVAGRRAALEAWFDRHAAVLADGDPALADLAYAVLAAEARLRAGADGAPLRGLLERLLARQDGPGTLTEQALTLLAFARSLSHGVAEGLAQAIETALANIRLDGSPAPQAEALGLVARAAGAVALAAEASAGALSQAVAARAQFLHRDAVALIRPLVRTRGATLEVVPTPAGGPADPAGQASVALGLLAPDAAILRLAPRMIA